MFGSLSDPIRRDILARVSTTALSVTEIAEPYDVTLAAISKHLKVLENAGLVTKTRYGKQQLVRLAPKAMQDAQQYFDFYKQHFRGRLDQLAEYLEEDQQDG